MNNSINKIEGLGIIKNQLIYNKKKNIKFIVIIIIIDLYINQIYI